MSNLLTFTLYKPKALKKKEFHLLLKDQIATLRKYEMISKNENHLIESKNGILIEIMLWENETAIDNARKHPAIRAIWGKMMNLCSFPPMTDLEEAKDTFPSFKKVEL